MAISRTREFSADAASAQYTGNPDELVSALRKLEAYSKRIPMDVSPSMSHMYIIQPLSGKSLASLFSTHPPTEERNRAAAEPAPELTLERQTESARDPGQTGAAKSASSPGTCGSMKPTSPDEAAPTAATRCAW